MYDVKSGRQEMTGSGAPQPGLSRVVFDTLTRRLLDALPELLLVLNAQRRVVFINRSLLQLLGPKEEAACLGKTPGMILDCSHALDAPGGCGTAEACGSCGAAIALLNGLAGRDDRRECRLTRCREGHFEALDLRVTSTPLEHGGEQLVVLAFNDVSHEKRRQSLERIFFHDILNLLGGIRGFAELLQMAQLDNRDEIYRLMYEASAQAIDEIEAQRMLLAAESGGLQPRAEWLDSQAVLLRMLELFRSQPVAAGRSLLLSGTAQVPGVPFCSDRVLLGRILGNMIKNALEATPPGGTVTLGCLSREGQVEFSVHNAGEIPRAVQVQIFKRYFSTKDRSRGLGTYSMKLLSEQLGGTVSFTSTADAGTSFRLRLPTTLPAATDQEQGR